MWNVFISYERKKKNNRSVLKIKINIDLKKNIKI